MIGLLVCTSTATAQDTVLQLKLRATCDVVGPSGKLVKQSITDQTILRQFAVENNISNVNAITMVYRVDGDERGDVIEIVAVETGDVLHAWLALFFPVELASDDGAQRTRFVHLYNHQQSEPMGSAMLREKLFDKKGNSNHTIDGSLQFYLTPNATEGLRMCTGTLAAGKPFVPHPPRGGNGNGGNIPDWLSNLPFSFTNFPGTGPGNNPGQDNP
jgi:hypothetical protein